MASERAATGIDYDRGASAYRRGRTLPSSMLATWRDAVAALSLPGGGRVLDLGSGTGQFLRPLAAWLDATPVHEIWRFEVPAWISRARQLRHIDSALRPFTDEEFEAGLAAIKNNPAHQQGTITNDFPLNLVALRRT